MLKHEKVKKIFSKSLNIKKKEKILNKIKCCLNELKNAITLKSVFKKIKIIILLLMMSKNTHSDSY